VKYKIPRTDEYYDIELEEEKKLIIAADMNEFAFTELIFQLMAVQVLGKC
jgi:hypothetical protein